VNATLTRDGYVGPDLFLDPRKAAEVLDGCRRPHPRCWYKGLATVSPAAARVARHPYLVALTRDALGPDVVLWGAHMLSRGPGEAHPWHTDIETANPRGRYVTAWIALEGGGEGSGLRVIPGSHLYGVSVQEARADTGVTRSGADDNAILRLARQFDPAASIVEVRAEVGHVVLFDGHTWHGSRNDTDAVRTALILQYAAADCPVRRADLSRLDWPFRYSAPAPCILIAGAAPAGVNTVVEAPA
jgi:ectoine hydroxylase-related dioxygenase (phytanoyl-CoA dioxygenase family)